MAEVLSARVGVQGRQSEPLMGPSSATVHGRLLLVDCVASAAAVGISYLIFWSWLTFVLACCLILVAMVAWRVYRWRSLRPAGSDNLPYTCGYANVDGKELFIVATLHISPRAPADVKAVILETRPQVVMIELDEERLDDMRAPTAVPTSDLQPITLHEDGKDPREIGTQRALWNGEFAGNRIKGQLFYNSSDPWGAGPPAESGGPLAVVPTGPPGHVALLQRGGPPGQRGIPFAYKAHIAARSGAAAALVVNTDTRQDFLPIARIGQDSLMGELKVAKRVRSCGYPPIPLLLLPKSEGDGLITTCREGAQALEVELAVKEDNYPRRTLPRRLCQTCAVACSGIAILYGVMECFAVDAGEEFLAAEVTAREIEVPCVCIDVDLDRLCSRVGALLLPTPCNIARAVRAWLAFPRVVFQVLFPPRHQIDVIGASVLHALSFRWKTWFAFSIASLCAGGVLACILVLFSNGVSGAAQGAGAVKEKDAEEFQAWLMLAVEAYVFPRLHEAVAASRDEAMYRGIVNKASQHQSSRSVAVVGAAHANGILEYIRVHGLARESDPEQA
eukprot:CAMPEP_0178395970 /NCGR_PEP_ID=MMETSP0689_2-20121128/13492_1 /TAXON_ID=160604 /ORGANISM="Amphidinium massartii, Strain CS-259" /LENGTH=560 /DNA_ID=CAMNT_0020016639 /DNA_START=60 /DNA_END=1742 /DNA_ORIENTATION=-